MQGKYILFFLVVILLFIAPGSASLNQISPQATVFIGESNVDISLALNGCHNISWWANGTDTSAPPAKSIALLAPNNLVQTTIFHYTFEPSVFSGYTGTWYCTDTQPPSPVFTVAEPQISIKVWDLDHNRDVTGETVPLTTNVTYRIDTNLIPALNYLYRPKINPADSFYTVTLTDPLGKNVPIIYTGSYGNPTTIMWNFDPTPYITSSPYYWPDGAVWNRSARNIQGDLVYPPGTYTFTVNQNLNGMVNISAPDGITNSSANVTFAALVPIVTTAQVTQPAVTTVPTTQLPSTEVTTIPTATPVAKKTTYASLPADLTVAGLIGAVALVARRP